MARRFGVVNFHEPIHIADRNASEADIAYAGFRQAVAVELRTGPGEDWFELLPETSVDEFGVGCKVNVLCATVARKHDAPDFGNVFVYIEDDGEYYKIARNIYDCPTAANRDGVELIESDWMECFGLYLARAVSPRGYAQGAYIYHEGMFGGDPPNGTADVAKIISNIDAWTKRNDIREKFSSAFSEKRDIDADALEERKA